MGDRDKRDYFRLDDTINIEVQLVTKEDANNHSPDHFFTQEANFHLVKEIYSLEIESTELLRSITSKDRQLGSFLSNLSKRIELVSKGLSNQSNVPEEDFDKETQISEGGVSYLSPEVINSGDWVALKLQFLPSMLGLTCFAEVRHCRLVEGSNKYRIGTRFMKADHATQRLLSRHIIRRQSEQRRARLKENSDFE